MRDFEIHDIYNAGHVDSYPKDCRSNDIWALTLEPSLEINFSLSKKVSIVILGIPMIIVIS